MPLATLLLVAPLVFSPQPSQTATADLAGPAHETVQLSGLAEILGGQIHPDVLASATFDPSAVSPVLAEIARTQKQLDAARRSHATLEENLARYRTAEGPLRAAVAEADQEFAAATKRASTSGKALDRVVASNFKDRHVPVRAGGSSSDDYRRRALAQRLDTQVMEIHGASIAEERRRQRTFQTLASAESVLLTKISVTIKQSHEEAAQAAAAEQRLGELGPQAVREVLAAPLVGLPFPVVVLDAYYKAEVSTRQARPRCQVSWFQLAGIGKVETRHGTYGGGSVEPTGQTSAPILGPELNGGPFMAISDTDGGVLDNNPVWDHAVGPMQFIPSSWELFGADGDGDSVRDPHNMYDAALAAANHLCGSRSGLAAPENFTSALLGYNRSTSYGLDVKRYASEYSQALDL